MAVLGAIARAKVARVLLRRAARRLFGVLDFTKPELASAVAAVDEWAEANAAAFNSALPFAFRTKASAAQKGVLLALVCLERAGILDEVA